MYETSFKSLFDLTVPIDTVVNLSVLNIRKM